MTRFELPLPFMTLFLSLLLLGQLYLFFRLRGYVYGKSRLSALRPLILSGAGAFSAAMVVLQVGHGLIATFAIGEYRLLHFLFLAAHVWGVGSLGCAVVLLIYGGVRAVHLYRIPESRPDEPDLGRRRFLHQGAGLAATAPFLLSGYGVAVERHRFEIDYLSVPIDGLSSSLSGLTIVQLTDIHVGPFMSAEELATFVFAVNRLRPDLIALTGDFIADNPQEVAPCVDTLAGLKARLGTFACIGNHEIHAKADDLLTFGLERAGIRVLRNTGVSLPMDSTRLSILGIDDLRAGRPDLDRALHATLEGGEVKVLLSHRPEIFPEAARGAVDLVLSGHYHGGQVKLARDPNSLSIARLLTPYAEGFFQLPRGASIREGDKRRASLFVSRGVGISGLPVRINCAPQIAHLTLRKA